MQSGKNSAASSSSFLEEVITESQKIFITGTQKNNEFIRYAIKTDIKKILRDDFPSNLNSSSCFQKLDELLSERIYDTQRIENADNSVCDLDISRLHLFYIRQREEKKYIDLMAEKLTSSVAKKITEYLSAKIVTPEIDANTFFNKLHNGLIKDIRTKKISIEDAIKKYFKAMNAYKVKLEIVEEVIKEILSNTSLPSEGSIYTDIMERHLAYFKEKFINETKEEIKSELIQEKNIKIKSVCKLRSCKLSLQYTDECFPKYNANWIKDSNFIAAAGPQYPDETAKFMHSILFSKKIRHRPSVTQIIALGNCLLNESLELYGYNRNLDFVNFYIDTRELTERTDVDPKLSLIVLDEAKNLKQKIQIENKYVSTQYAVSDSNDFPKGVVESELTIFKDAEENSTTNAKRVDVLLIGVSSNESINLSQDDDETLRLKAKLCQIANRSKNEAIVVHSAGGVGRVGHVILMLEILKNYDEVFDSNNPSTVARNIESILQRIRKNRPAAITIVEQYISAIRNADILYRYAYEKKYISEPAKVSTMSLLSGIKKSPKFTKPESEMARARWCGLC